ncbi:MAG: hypothetical protein Tsb0016_07930 [Sphingomonadales bacterium]
MKAALKAMALASCAFLPACADTGGMAAKADGAPVTNQAYQGHAYRSHYVALKSGPRVHYLDEGTGDVPLLLIHGMPTQAYLWRHVIPGLAENNRVIAIDQPNWGKSDLTPEVRGGVPCAGDYAGWIGEFVDALGLDKVRLVVHDMGFVGLLYAARNPGKVDGVVLFETAIGPFPRDMAPPFLEAFFAPNGEQVLVDQNYMVETLLFNNAFNDAGDPPFRTMTRDLSETERAIYYEPFETHEGRRAMLFDRECLGFIGARPTDPGSDERKAQNLSEFMEFGQYLSTTDTPRLVVFGNPGFVLPRQPMEAIVTGQAPAEMGGWQNTATVSTAQITAPSLHYWQEEENGAPQELARVIQQWLDENF